MSEYRQLASRALRGEALELEDIQNVVVALGGGLYTRDLPSDETLVEPLLDCLHALREVEAYDPAWPWNTGGLLAACGRQLEAAIVYLRAAELFRKDARGGPGLTADEDDWAEASAYHAANALASAGRPLTAAIVAANIHDAGFREEAVNRVAREIERS